MEHGYHYLVALTEAIAQWSEVQVEADPKRFVYRGADLRFAIERTIYFALINDVACHAVFNARYEGRKDTPMLRQSAYFDLIDPYLVQRTKGAEIPQRRGANSAHAKFSRLLPKAARDSLRNGLRFVSRTFRSAVSSTEAEFLFLVTQPKFIRYLQPIYEGMHEPSAYLTVDDISTQDFLQRSGEKVASLTCRSHGVGASDDLALFSGICDQFDALAHFVAKSRVRAIVVPEGNAAIYEIVRLAAASQGVPTICAQHGWSPIAHTGFRNLHFSKMLVWGDLFAELLAPFNPVQKFIVTGLPVPIARMRQRAIGEPVKAVGFFLQKGGEAFDDKVWRDFLALIGWLAAAYPEVNVIVRDHPSTPGLDAGERVLLGDGENLRFMNPATHTLAEVLEACDIVASVYSTTLLEAISVGAVPLICGFGDMPGFWPNLAALGAAVEVHDIAEAKRELTRLIEDAVFRDDLRRGGTELRPRLFASSANDAVTRIVNEVERSSLRL